MFDDDDMPLSGTGLEMGDRVTVVARTGTPLHLRLTCDAISSGGDAKLLQAVTELRLHQSAVHPKKWRAALLRAQPPVLPRLVACLDSEQDSLQHEAACVLLNYLHWCSMQQLVEAGALPPLVQLAASHKLSRIRTTGALCLGNLCNEADAICTAVVEAGGLRALCEGYLLDPGDADVRRTVSWAVGSCFITSRSVLCPEQEDEYRLAARVLNTVLSSEDRYVTGLQRIPAEQDQRGVGVGQLHTGHTTPHHTTPHHTTPHYRSSPDDHEEAWESVWRLACSGEQGPLVLLSGFPDVAEKAVAVILDSQRTDEQQETTACLLATLCNKERTLQAVIDAGFLGRAGEMVAAFGGAHSAVDSVFAALERIAVHQSWAFWSEESVWDVIGEGLQSQRHRVRHSAWCCCRALRSIKPFAKRSALINRISLRKRQLAASAILRCLHTTPRNVRPAGWR